MKLIAFLQMWNEVERGNLRRCLDNCRQWADDIVIYDDGSTDDSVAVAREYTEHIILGGTRDFRRELFHKQRLLEYVLTLNPTWIFWLDCDEILDRGGTTGGLRKLAEEAPPDVLAYGFKEVQLWRSQTYARTDGYWFSPWFVRLWRVTPGMHIDATEGLDRPSYPSHIKEFRESNLFVIHYKFSDYRKLFWGSGLGYKTKAELIEIARHNHIFNESALTCYRVPDEWFPVEHVPPNLWKKPKPRPLEDLKAWNELTPADDLL